MANIQHRVAIVLTAAVLSAITLAHAASDRRAPSPLDDRIRHREGGAISVAPRGLAGLAASDALRAGWEHARPQALFLLQEESQAWQRSGMLKLDLPG